MPVNPNLYNDIIPQPTDQISQSQNDLLDNFGAIKTLVDQNHVDFAAGSPQAGKHNAVSLPVQSASPPVGQFATGEIGLYSFLDSATSQNELYFNNFLGQQIPITETITGGSGYTYLPSGIIIQWTFDSTSAPGTNPQTTLWQKPFPNACFVALACAHTTTAAAVAPMRVNSFNQTQVIVQSGAPNTTPYVVIGIGN